MINTKNALDSLLLFSGVAYSVSDWIDLINVAIPAFLTATTVASIRLYYTYNQIKTSKRKVEQELFLEKKAHEQRLRQEQERHEIEMQILKSKLNDSNDILGS